MITAIFVIAIATTIVMAGLWCVSMIGRSIYEELTYYKPINWDLVTLHAIAVMVATTGSLMAGAIIVHLIKHAF